MLEGGPDLSLEALFVGVDPKRKNVAAAIGLIGERVLRDGEGDAGTMPGHLKVAGARLDRRDDLGCDFGVNVSWLRGGLSGLLAHGKLLR